ncbi:MAG: hypothetical protein J1E64_15150 [Acetatifactor sp.]|nr:hypothetical protein [Acetatifactor sp.]
MAVMKRGFYNLKPYIYYGDYPQEQVSGYARLSVVKPEYIKTDVPFSNDDVAVSLYNNHALTEQELVDMEQALQKIMRCINVKEFNKVMFTETEQRLGIELPKEIKILYTALCQMDTLMFGEECFLPLDELYMDKENLVFYKVKRTPIALSLNDGVLMNYHKKEWNYDQGNESFLCYVLDRLVVKAITEMPMCKKGKISGELRTIVSPRNPLQEIFKGKFNVLEEYRNYGNIILFNENGALGWFRQNGFFADILIGCLNEKILTELLSTSLSVKWE